MRIRADPDPQHCCLPTMLISSQSVPVYQQLLSTNSAAVYPQCSCLPTVLLSTHSVPVYPQCWCLPGELLSTNLCLPTRVLPSKHSVTIYPRCLIIFSPRCYCLPSVPVYPQCQYLPGELLTVTTNLCHLLSTAPPIMLSSALPLSQ